jgi:hypothetical protein
VVLRAGKLYGGAGLSICYPIFLDAAGARFIIEQVAHLPRNRSI